MFHSLRWLSLLALCAFLGAHAVPTFDSAGCATHATEASHSCACDMEHDGDSCACCPAGGEAPTGAALIRAMRCNDSPPAVASAPKASDDLICGSVRVLADSDLGRLQFSHPDSEPASRPAPPPTPPPR